MLENTRKCLNINVSLILATGTVRLVCSNGTIRKQTYGSAVVISRYVHVSLFFRCPLQKNFSATLSNTFHATGLFLYPLKTSENLWFSNVFRGYTKRQAVWNWLHPVVKNCRKRTMEVIQTTSVGFALIKLFLVNVPILHPLNKSEDLFAPLPLLITQNRFYTLD